MGKFYTKHNKSRFKTYYRLSNGMLEQTKPTLGILAKADTNELLKWLRVYAVPVPHTGLKKWVGKPASQMPDNIIRVNPPGFLGG